MPAGERCLITGAAGFIGSYLTEFLLGEGREVYGTVHRQRHTTALLHDRMHLIPCDLRERRQVAEAVREGRAPLGDHRDGLEAMRLVFAAYEAAGQGKALCLQATVA